jgi:GxxExxY protein
VIHVNAINQRPMPAPFDERVRAITGAALEVHAELGPGYLEPVYQEALALEFGLRGIEYKREVYVPVLYKGRRLAQAYRADFVCYAGIVVELKAVQLLSTRDDAQVLNYMKATGHPHALLFNFGLARLQLRRLGSAADALARTVFDNP